MVCKKKNGTTDDSIRNDVRGISGHVLFFQSNSPCTMTVIVRRPIQKPNEFVEPMMDRVVLVLVPTMPFAKQSRRISVVLKHTWKGCDGWQNSAVWLAAADNHMDDTDSLLVTSG